MSRTLIIQYITKDKVKLLSFRKSHVTRLDKNFTKQRLGYLTCAKVSK